jgi:hypothetical protein
MPLSFSFSAPHQGHRRAYVRINPVSTSGISTYGLVVSVFTVIVGTLFDLVVVEFERCDGSSAGLVVEAVSPCLECLFDVGHEANSAARGPLGTHTCIVVSVLHHHIYAPHP